MIRLDDTANIGAGILTGPLDLVVKAAIVEPTTLSPATVALLARLPRHSSTKAERQHKNQQHCPCLQCGVHRGARHAFLSST